MFEDNDMYNYIVKCFREVSNYKIENKEESVVYFILIGSKSYEKINRFIYNKKYEMIKPMVTLNDIKDLLPNDIFYMERETMSIRNKIVHSEEVIFSLETLNKYRDNLLLIYRWFCLEYFNLEINENSILVVEPEKQNNNINEKEQNISLILEKIANNYKDIKEDIELILQTQIELSEKQDTVIKKIDELKEQIQLLSSDIKESKDRISYIVDNKYVPSEVIETTISKFQEELTDKLFKSIGQCTNANTYLSVGEELKNVLGEDNYKKLKDKSKNFIITAKIMYDELKKIEGELDYSGVCLLLTKALENECHIRFYDGYLNYMNTRYGSNTENYPLWCINVVNGREYLKRPNDLTLGGISFALRVKKIKNDDDSLLNTMNNYLKDNLFIEKDSAKIAQIMNDIGTKVDLVTQNYRNPSAHTNPMNEVKATECFSYLLEVQKLMQEILSNCRY